MKMWVSLILVLCLGIQYSHATNLSDEKIQEILDHSINLDGYKEGKIIKKINNEYVIIAERT